MKHNTRKPFCLSGNAYRMQPAVHPGWRPAVPTRMEMTMMTRPTAPGGYIPILARNWCHLFTPLRAKWFSDTTDTNLWRKMMSVALSSEIGFLHTTDTNLAQEIMIATPLKGKRFLHTTDTNLSQGTVCATPLTHISFFDTTRIHFPQGKASRGVPIPTRALSRAGRRVLANLSALTVWNGGCSVSWCWYGLKAQNLLMGWVSPTNFPRKGRSSGGGMCYAQVNSRRGPAVLASSSLSFHPANLEGVPSRCTL